MEIIVACNLPQNTVNNLTKPEIRVSASCTLACYFINMIMDIYVLTQGEKDLSEYGIERDDVFGVEINCQAIFDKS